MYCVSCGKELDATAHFCSSCGAAFYAGPYPLNTPLMRPRSPRMVGGVCAAFAEHYGWDLSLVRVLTVVLTLCTVVAAFVYLAAWIIIPEGPYALSSAPASPSSSASPSN